MSDVIEFPTPSKVSRSNVIVDAPMRMRWGDWATSRIIQVHVAPAAAYEHQREEDIAAGRPLGAQMPSHFSLDGPMHDTALAMLRHRESLEELEDVCYLAALMETLVNVPCAILRTDLIRRVYREVQDLSERLHLKWRAHSGHFLLPLNQDAQDPDFFARSLAGVNNLSEFFAILRGIAKERNKRLTKEYVLYFPGRPPQAKT